MRATRVLYSGRVQNVGFRATVKAISHGFAVTGWVRNLEDGRVELFAQSHSADELENFLADIVDGELHTKIRHVDRNEVSPDANEVRFRIRY